jgi:hypothetical protein
MYINWFDPLNIFVLTLKLVWFGDNQTLLLPYQKNLIAHTFARASRSYANSTIFYFSPTYIMRPILLEMR